MLDEKNQQKLGRQKKRVFRLFADKTALRTIGSGGTVDLRGGRAVDVKSTIHDARLVQ